MGIGGGKGGSSQPAVPDYVGAANLAGLYGIGNTLTQFGLNNPNINSPYGSITYSNPYFGGGGSSTQTGGPAGSWNPQATGLPTMGGSGLPTLGGGGSIGSTGGTPNTHASDSLYGMLSGIPFSNGHPANPFSGSGALNYALGVGDSGGQLADPLNLFGKSGGSSQSTPSFGNASVPFVPPGSTTETITLSPAQQNLLNHQESTQGALANTGSNITNALSNTTGQLDLSKLPNVMQGADQINKNVVDSLYKQQQQYLDPQFAQQQSSLDAQLRAQGLSPGSEAYKNAMTNFNNTKQQAYSNAMYNAQQGGTQAGYAASQENLAGAQQGLNEMLTQQNLPLQQIQQILGMTVPQGPPTQGTAGVGQSQSPNLLQALESQYGAQLGNYNAQQASSNQLLGTLGSLGMMAMMFM